MESTTFKEQLDGEEVIRVVRRDLVFVFNRIAVFLLIVSAVGAAIFMIDQVFPSIKNTEYYPILVLVGMVFAFYAWLFLFLTIKDSILDVWYITNLRLINIQQEGLFSRKVFELYLTRAQDVASTKVGVLATVLRYGNVAVQTAGEREDFVFENVPDPEGVRKVVIELIKKTHEGKTTE